MICSKFSSQGGVEALLKELESQNMVPLPTVHKRVIREGKFEAKGFKCNHINDEEEFQVGDDNNTRIKAVYCPGHTGIL